MLEAASRVSEVLVVSSALHTRLICRRACFLNSRLTPAVMSGEKMSRSTFRAAQYGRLTINKNCSVSLTYFEEYVILTMCY